MSILFVKVIKSTEITCDNVKKRIYEIEIGDRAICGHNCVYTMNRKWTRTNEIEKKEPKVYTKHIYEIEWSPSAQATNIYYMHIYLAIVWINKTVHMLNFFLN